MSKDGRNVRQRSRVQGAWGQPPRQLTGSSARRPWQHDEGQNENRQQRFSYEAATPTNPQQDLTLYGHGATPRNSRKQAESLEPKMPKNFSWVVDGHICAMGFPGQPENILYLVKNNVRYLISLTAEREPPVDGFPDLTLINVKVVDFTPPSIEQVEQCLSIFEKAGQEGKGVGINCAHGRGRTGTVLACYFVKQYNMEWSEAINQIRFYRPGSIETREQERFVEEFKQHLSSQGKS